MRITLASITDYMRVRHVEIRPAADANVIFIAGRNANGKSSVFSAFEAALGGKGAVASDPVRHSASAADIKIEFDNGALTVKRHIAPDGTSTLEVRDANGKVKSPQAMLDQLIGQRFIDPLNFLLLQPKEQRSMMLKLVDKDSRIDTLEKKRASNYEARTNIGRDLDKAKGELSRLEERQVAAPIDVAALAAERAAMSEEQRKHEGLTRELHAAEVERDSVEVAADQAGARIQELEFALARAREVFAAEVDKLAAKKQEVAHRQESLRAAAEVWAAGAARRVEVDADLARADVHNREVFAAEEGNRRRAAAVEAVDALAAQYADRTSTLEKIERIKLEILKAAKLPVENLGVSPEGLTLNDVPFSQASAAEKLRVAIGLAIAASPNLDDIWMRDGSLLDDESIKMAVEHADQAGKRIWIEIIRPTDGAIVIEDGKVADA